MNWIPQASGDMSGWHKLRDFYEIIGMLSMRAASLSCPLWRLFFANFSRTLRVTQCLLVTARSFAVILLDGSSQLPLLGLAA